MRSVVVTILLLAGTARAEPDEPKSAATATWLATGTTVAGYALLTMTFVVGVQDNAGRATLVAGSALITAGPSLGHFYAHDWTRTPGMAMRASAPILALVGMFVIAAECEDLDPCTPGHPIGTTVLGLAGALLIGGSVWDIATTPAAVRRYNRSHASVSIVPMIVPTLGPQPGLAVQGRF